VLAVASLNPFSTKFGETHFGIDILRSTGIVQVDKGFVVVILYMHTTKGDLEDVGGGFMNDSLVFLCGLRKGIIVGDTLNGLKVWIEWIERRFGATGWFGVGFATD
jgi:hypothetical protein